MKILEYTIGILFYTLCFCCFVPFNPKLTNENKFKKDAEMYFPNSTFIEVKKEGKGQKNYSFENDEFKFEISDKVEDSTDSGIPPFVKDKEISSSYFTNLIQYKEEEIQQLCNKYNVDYYNGIFYGDGSYVIAKENELEEKLDNAIKTTFVIDNYNGIEFNFYVQNKNDIPIVFDLLNDIENSLSPYYPKKSVELFKFQKRLIIYNNLNNSSNDKRNKLLYDVVEFPNDWSKNYYTMEIEILNGKIKN